MPLFRETKGPDRPRRKDMAGSPAGSDLGHALTRDATRERAKPERLIRPDMLTCQPDTAAVEDFRSGLS